MGFIEKFLCQFDSMPKRALVFRKITDKKPAIRAITFKGAAEEARKQGITNPIFMVQNKPEHGI